MSCRPAITLGPGETTEGSVAALMWDLTDPANESHDTLALTGSYVAGVIAQCRENYFGISLRLDGIDTFIYCAEGTIDATATALLTERAPPQSITPPTPPFG